MLFADDDADPDVLDPAQLAFDQPDSAAQHQDNTEQQDQQQQQQQRVLQQQAQKLGQQQQQQQQQQQHDQQLWPAGQLQPVEAAARQAGEAQVESARPVEHGHLCFHAGDGAEAKEEAEELICMGDPRFVSLSERRQKLMALEEVLLETGIDG